MVVEGGHQSIGGKGSGGGGGGGRRGWGGVLMEGLKLIIPGQSTRR